MQSTLPKVLFALLTAAAAPALRAGEPAAHALPADTGALTLEASPLARFFGLTDPAPAADAPHRDALRPPAARPTGRC